MKKIFMMMFLFTTVFLSGTTTVELEQPTNFEFDGALTWNEVMYAQTYLITINDETIERDIAYLDGFIQEGTYNVEVIAQATGYEDSPVGSYVIVIDYLQEAVIDVVLSNQRLTWNDVMDATHYLVTYNDSFTIVTDVFLELPDMMIDDYSVQAVFPDGSKTPVFSYEN